ncbi:DUF916 and DUF3324 domain-containing protein [Enterococcus sp. 669A]|uniref:DUF916 and DUF3324 domain-containing protein n=1 Tax=Candidatus Enterococcus moelleringii TaxID=2815325 RepID=A0ABS3L5J8_9ENTE|nr:DUF916 and DUF3324 domain-containing protein [Enterococcus sp. 669A]MBO1304896.1 DUF916 and DUF3324 domain-containing protein [Enterococcus sp. 669A]
MKKKRWMIISVLLVVLSFLPAVNAQAAGAGFTLEAVRPDNQISDATYFDLQVAPNQTEDLTVRVTNQEDQAIKVEVSPNPAFTNQNGTIEYSQHDYRKDSSAQYTLSELISGPQEVQLNPKESKDVTFTVKVPADSFKGTISGGFYGKEVDQTEETQTSDQQATLAIKNEYALVLGISLTEDQNQKVTPELKLNDVKPALADSHTAVIANLQNVEPIAFGAMTVDAKIYKKGDSEVLKETKKENQEMAPNSNYDFAVGWDNQPLQAGDYQLKLDAASGNKTWHFERDFTIAADEAKAINKKAVDLPEQNYWWLLIILLVVILLGATYAYGKRKGKQGSR